MDGNFPNNNDNDVPPPHGGPPHPEATPTDQLPGNRTPSPPLIFHPENFVNVPAPPLRQLDEGGPPIPEATPIHSLPGNRTPPPTASQNENLGNEIIHNVAARGLEVIMNMIAGKNNE